MKSLKGIIYAIIATSTFGLIPLFAVPAMKGGIGVNSLLLYRFGIAAIILGIILVIKGQNLRVRPKEFGIITILGALAGCTAIILTTSYLYIPSGIATTIHFLHPVIVTAIMTLFFHARITYTKIIAVVLAVLGVILLTNNDYGELNYKGVSLALMTVFTYALYIVGVNKSPVTKMDGLKLTFYVLTISSIIFALNLLIRGEALDIPNKSTILPVLSLALLPTVVSDTLFIMAIQNVGSTTVSTLGCMEPLTAIIVGIFFFGEKINFSQSIGIGIIIVAVTLIILSSKISPKNRKEAN